LNGAELRSARRRLGLSGSAVARLMMVAVSTVSRWERSKGDENVDPFHAELILHLVAIAKRPFREANACAQLLKGALGAAPTYGLYVLLSIAYNDNSLQDLREHG
jgi:transcriptional regulator with XRE-family HTH domain